MSNHLLDHLSTAIAKGGYWPPCLTLDDSGAPFWDQPGLLRPSAHPAHVSRFLWVPAAEVAGLAAQLQLAAPLEELLMQAQLLEQLPLGVRGSSSRLAAPVAQQGTADGEA